MDPYSSMFDESESLRSAFVRKITLQQLARPSSPVEEIHTDTAQIPKRLIRYWHDSAEVPEDVRECLDSWNRLAEEGFEFHMFDDPSAIAYIAERYSERESQAFSRCHHPAMRCDYLRMCFILAEGGFYVDADDVLLGQDWRQIFVNGKLKLQPLCYDVSARGMVAAAEIWRSDLPTDGRIFYVNNDPIAAPANHPVLERALACATDKLLDETRFAEIQSTTGPGNLTSALATHAHRLEVAGVPFDFELLRNWDSVAETRWHLSYRADNRNWRNVFGG